MEEKRRYKRIFFSSHEKMTARFAVSGDAGPVETMVLNLSEGGLGLSLKKSENVLPKPGDRLLLKEIGGAAGLDAVMDVKAEVKWVIHLEQLQHIGFGCEFLHLPPGARSQLQKFVSDWEHRRKSR